MIIILTLLFSGQEQITLDHRQRRGHLGLAADHRVLGQEVWNRSWVRMGSSINDVMHIYTL